LTAGVQIGALVQNFAGFPESGLGAAACLRVAERAEAVGLDSVWVTDHVVLPVERRARYPHNDTGTFPYTWDQDIHEPVALLGALAAVTTRVQLGTAVLVIPYRHPLLVAKMLATIDDLAGGRVVLGAGVGWLRDEFEALGLGDDVFTHRGSVTEDFLRAMRIAWTADDGATYDGRWTSFRDVGTAPRPRRPVPVWIGGRGEQALRRAARMGDGWFAIGTTPADLAGEVRRLRELTAEAGRDPAAVTVALIEGIAFTERPLDGERPPLRGTPEQVAEGLAAFRQAGLDHLAAGIRLAGHPSLEGTLHALELAAGLERPA
jgi:probable F420-dependent oxidoreductase